MSYALNIDKTNNRIEGYVSTTDLVGGFFQVLYVAPGTLQNRWCHYALTFDGSVLRVYLNGILVNQTTGCSGTIKERAAIPAIIGARVGDSGNPSRADWFKGKLSDDCIFDRALTPTEIAAIYRQGRGLRYELIQQYTDPTNVYVVMNAGAGYNEYLLGRAYTERWWPGRVLCRRSIGWSGMMDEPTIRVVTDVDSLAVVESAIPSQNHSDA
jgi:hypothetical protein